MWTREQLKTNAKMNFKRNYWPCVGVGVIVSILSAGFAVNGGNSADYANQSQGAGFPGSSGVFVAIVAMGMVVSILGILFSVFIGNVLKVGTNKFFIQNRSEMPSFGTVIDAFRSGHYGNVVVVMILKDIFTALWTLLFVVPGIIKGLEYLMIPYILAENPGMDRKDAFAISKRMMDGEKWNTFVLELSFIGWYLAAAVTCGLAGIFYVTPYVEATFAELYAYNKGKAYQEGYIR